MSFILRLDLAFCIGVMNNCKGTHLISVKIQLRGLLSWIENYSEIELEVPSGTNLTDVLVIVANRYGQGLQKVLFHTDGKVYRGLAVSINQKTIPYHDLDRIRIKEPCILTVIPLAAGG